jgi:putative flippase GtrA
MILSRLWQNSFVRFLFVGVLNTLIGLSSILILFNVVGIGYWLSTFLGNTIGGVASYFLNRRITFRSNMSFKRSWWKFMIVVFLCYVLSYFLGLWIVKWTSPYFPTLSQEFLDNAAVIVGSGLYTVSNYVGHRYFTFRIQ